MSKYNDFPVEKLQERIEYLSTPEGLKEAYPLYPSVRRKEFEAEITFSTLVRKRYEGKYYLIPMLASADTEAKAIHLLHSNVYKYLMNGKRLESDILDNDQLLENDRLRAL